MNADRSVLQFPLPEGNIESAERTDPVPVFQSLAGAIRTRQSLQEEWVRWIFERRLMSFAKTDLVYPRPRRSSWILTSTR